MSSSRSLRLLALTTPSGVTVPLIYCQFRRFPLMFAAPEKFLRSLWFLWINHEFNCVIYRHLSNLDDDSSCTGDKKTTFHQHFNNTSCTRGTSFFQARFSRELPYFPKTLYGVRRLVNSCVASLFPSPAYINIYWKLQHISLYKDYIFYSLSIWGTCSSILLSLPVTILPASSHQ